MTSPLKAIQHLTEDEMQEYNNLIKRGRSLTDEDDVVSSFEVFKKAYAINPSDKLKRRLKRMKDYLVDNNLWVEHGESRPKNLNEENKENVAPERTDEPQGDARGVEPSDERTNEANEERNDEASDDRNDEEAVAKFNGLITRGKDDTRAGRLAEALGAYNEAQTLFPSDKLLKRIKKIEDFLAAQAEDSDEEGEGAAKQGSDMVHVGDGYYLYKELYNNLYDHQRQGVLWMWGLFKKRKGGILGDDMGLGKTIQVISFLSGMFDSERIKSVLIVLPVAVMVNWEREFSKWAPGITIENFHTNTKREKVRALEKTARRGGVVLTSYGMLVRPENIKMLSTIRGEDFTWDYIFLDEGHKIKNPSSKCTKGINSLAARHRLILTGTPIQNNLKEMWTLFDWTHQGSLLGTAKTFSMQFENPINRARQKDATVGEQRIGLELSVMLKNIIEPFFCRRVKSEVARREKEQRLQREGGEEEEGDVRRNAPEMPVITRKNDLVLWVFLSETQEKIYNDFTHQEDIKELLNTSKSPLTALTQLKKICDHPRLLTVNQCTHLGLDMDHGFATSAADGDTAAVSRIAHVPDHVLVEESGKMRVLAGLLDQLKLEGHRCLVFSQSRKMLDIIQKILTNRGHRVARLDGTIRHLAEREDIIEKFTKNQDYSVFLLTTQVGGVGLTLTAADRVVIYDPSWNPATDAQAVDRAFRIGQRKNVVVYRLITCGSVEEKIYRRQIFKDSITKQTTGESQNPYRYFSRQELRELFVLENTRHSSTQVQLAELQRGQRNTDTGLDAHIAFLHTLEMFGVSDHDLMFNRDAEEDEVECSEEQTHIQNRVLEARRLMTLEAEENENQARQDGRYAAPEVFSTREPRTVAPPRQQFQPKTYDSDEDAEDEMNRTFSQHLHMRDSPDMDQGSDQDDSHISIQESPEKDTFTTAKEAVSRPNFGRNQDGGHFRSRYEELVPEGLSEEEQLRMALQMSKDTAYAPPRSHTPPPRSPAAPRSPTPPPLSPSDKSSPDSGTEESSRLLGTGGEPGTPVSQAGGVLARLNSAVRSIFTRSPQVAHNLSSTASPLLSSPRGSFTSGAASVSAVARRDSENRQLRFSGSPGFAAHRSGEGTPEKLTDRIVSPFKYANHPAGSPNRQISDGAEDTPSPHSDHSYSFGRSPTLVPISPSDKPVASRSLLSASSEPRPSYSATSDTKALRTAVTSPVSALPGSSALLTAVTSPVSALPGTSALLTAVTSPVSALRGPSSQYSVSSPTVATISSPAAAGLSTPAAQSPVQHADFAHTRVVGSVDRESAARQAFGAYARGSSSEEHMAHRPASSAVTSPESDTALTSPRRSGDSTLGYETFIGQVQARANCDSTRIGDLARSAVTEGGLEEDIEEAEEEDMDAEQDEGSEAEEEDESSEDELSPEDEERYRDYVLESRRFYKAGDLAEAVKLVIKAIQIYDGDPKVIDYASRLHRKIKERQG